MTQPVLDLDFAPSVWVVGPNDSHPFDTWIGPAVDRTLARFELPPGPGQAREVVTEILTRIGTYQDLLAYFVLHCPSPLEPPLPLYLGLHERVDRETIDAWLGGADLSTVEQPLVDSVPVDREGVSLLRSLPYSNGEDGSVVIGARYVVDVGHDDMIVLARTASFAAKSLIAAQSAVVELLSSVRVVTSMSSRRSHERLSPRAAVPVDPGAARRQPRETVAGLMDDPMRHVPKELPPDQVLPMRRRVEGDLLRNLREARDASGVAAYFPAGLMHGNRLNATFTVSSAVPDAMAGGEMSARVVTALLADADSRSVTIDDTVWVRRERGVASTAAPAGRSTPSTSFSRRGEYRAPVPGDPAAGSPSRSRPAATAT